MKGKKAKELEGKKTRGGGVKRQARSVLARAKKKLCCRKRIFNSLHETGGRSEEGEKGSTSGGPKRVQRKGERGRNFGTDLMVSDAGEDLGIEGPANLQIAVQTSRGERVSKRAREKEGKIHSNRPKTHSREHNKKYRVTINLGRNVGFKKRGRGACLARGNGGGRSKKRRLFMKGNRFPRKVNSVQRSFRPESGGRGPR